VPCGHLNRVLKIILSSISGIESANSRNSEGVGCFPLHPRWNLKKTKRMHSGCAVNVIPFCHIVLVRAWAMEPDCLRSYLCCAGYMLRCMDKFLYLSLCLSLYNGNNNNIYSEHCCDN
jgi:hypothetical protein